MATDTSKPKAEPERVDLPANIPPELATELLAVIDRHLADAQLRERLKDLPTVEQMVASGVSREIAEERRALLERWATGVKDPEQMRKAAERMDRMRESMPPLGREVSLEIRGTE